MRRWKLHKAKNDRRKEWEKAPFYRRYRPEMPTPLLLLDGSRMLEREQAYDYLYEALHLPAYFGRNLDALWDLLGECRKARLVLYNAAVLEESGDETAQALWRLFWDFSRAGGRVAVFPDRPFALTDLSPEDAE